MTPTAATPAPDRFDQATLERVAELVDDAFALRAADDPTVPGQIVRVEADPPDADELQLGFLPLLDDEHPTTPLLGVAAPSTWLAAGCVVLGHARSLDDPGAGRERIRMTFLLGRDGHGTSLVTPVAGPPSARRALGAPSDGFVVDVFRRAFGLPTPPPAGGPGPWLEARWLDAVLAAAAAEPARWWTWAEVAELHPLVEPGDPPTPEELRARTAALDDVAGWGTLRAAAAAAAPVADADAAPPPGAPPITPELAAWFDDGSFARYVLDATLDLPSLTRTLRALLPARTLRCTRRALGRHRGAP